MTRIQAPSSGPMALVDSLGQLMQASPLAAYIALVAAVAVFAAWAAKSF